MTAVGCLLVGQVRQNYVRSRLPVVKPMQDLKHLNTSAHYTEYKPVAFCPAVFAPGRYTVGRPCQA